MQRRLYLRALSRTTLPRSKLKLSSTRKKRRLAGLQLRSCAKPQPSWPKQVRSKTLTPAKWDKVGKRTIVNSRKLSKPLMLSLRCSMQEIPRVAVTKKSRRLLRLQERKCCSFSTKWTWCLPRTLDFGNVHSEESSPVFFSRLVLSSRTKSWLLEPRSTRNR